MNIASRPSRFLATRLLARVLACAVVLVVCSQFEAAQASIVVHELPDFTVDEIDAERESDSANSSAPANQPSEQPETPPEPFIAYFAIHFDGTSSNSSSSSGNNFSSSNSSAISSSCSVPLAHDLAGWLSGERRLLLPMPLCNDLLRPPQAC